eukprot:TRINITY_DN81353_c0_g1_i1.p1 TRINITY_DN81353_c0_g1~~TRINITY_DN81353_c0_g1_i1.p1  ORF type:complete len:275 (+),score=52.30 TRINITY_DN81353_c0_g1_i1:23-826(+)
MEKSASRSGRPRWAKWVAKDWSTGMLPLSGQVTLSLAHGQRALSWRLKRLGHRHPTTLTTRFELSEIESKSRGRSRPYVPFQQDITWAPERRKLRSRLPLDSGSTACSRDESQDIDFCGQHPFIFATPPQVTFCAEVVFVEAPTWYLEALASEGDWDWREPSEDLPPDVLARLRTEAMLRQRAKSLLGWCQDEDNKQLQCPRSDVRTEVEARNADLRKRLEALAQEADELERERDEWNRKKASWKVRNDAAREEWKQLKRIRGLTSS